jgi:hypothetical protein
MMWVKRIAKAAVMTVSVLIVIAVIVQIAVVPILPGKTRDLGRILITNDTGTMLWVNTFGIGALDGTRAACPRHIVLAPGDSAGITALDKTTVAVTGSDAFHLDAVIVGACYAGPFVRGNWLNLPSGPDTTARMYGIAAVARAHGMTYPGMRP